MNVDCYINSVQKGDYLRFAHDNYLVRGKFDSFFGSKQFYLLRVENKEPVTRELWKPHLMLSDTVRLVDQHGKSCQWEYVPWPCPYPSE